MGNFPNPKTSVSDFIPILSEECIFHKKFSSFHILILVYSNLI